MKSWIEQFKDPEAKYRPHPFWSWNDDLEEDELRRQIREMKETGQGGFFMHARDGLITPYMKDKWFDLVHACTDEAEKCGIEAWCYDELGWPSGSAGGAIPDMGDEYCVRWLRLREYEGEVAGDLIGFFAVKGNGYRKLSSADAPLEDGERVMYATSFCDTSYFDILNPDTVRAFIDHTYEGYREKCGGDFGKAGLFGFFTDEPQFALCRNPWSPIIADEFKKEYGYDINDHAPALLLGRDGYEDIRYDFWSLVNRLFTESFAKQIGEWCDENGCLLTGHAMMEDNMLCQIHCTAGCMPMYEHMQIPGIDWLGRHLGRNPVTSKYENPITPLQVGSVAAQMGKKQVLTETFAMCGWEMNFSEMLHLIEWQFLGGVNLVCQHLGAYSIRERRKADYPPSFFHQSPWFKDSKVFTDRVSRLGKILSCGKDDSDVLLVHPMHSIWLKYTNNDLCAEQDFDDRFAALATKLAKAHVPFHLGDETVMARHGKVDGSCLSVGLCNYHTVLLPEMWGLDRSTYELLAEYKANGGRILRLGNIPEYIDGRRAEEEIKTLYDGIPFLDLSKDSGFMENIRKFYVQNGISDVSVTSAFGEEESIQLCRRQFTEEGYTAYFFLNMDSDRALDVSIEIKGNDAVELCIDTMELARHPSFAKDGRVTLDLRFAPRESHLIIVGDALPDAPMAEYLAPSTELPLYTGAGKTEKWRLGKNSDPNCCTLEYCSVGDGSTFSEEMHVYRGLRAAKDLAEKGIIPSVRFAFDIDKGTDLAKLSDMKAVCEEMKPYRLFINGTEAPYTEGEWWLDHSFSVHSIGAFVKHGRNEIVFTDFCKERDGKLMLNSEFGNMYLTGNFGVFFDRPFIDCHNRGLSAGENFRLADRPTEFTGGSIVPQGHPFFAGHITLEKDVYIERTDIKRHVELKSLYCACASVAVNGKKGRLLTWGSLRDDVTDRLKEGKNTIGIELTVGNRNLLGPHHLPEAKTLGAGPGDFAPYEPSKWNTRYGFEKAGLSD